MADLATLDALIVDDHEPMRAMLRKVLERTGFGSVREAASGAEALAALQERPAQLILVDRNMPGMTGADFIACAREDGSSARIVMITGDARAEVSGADALLVKPVSPRELLAAIAEVMERAASGRA
jgi:two-component system, chemotaxis family, chemotaxis protein CheY